MVITLQQINNVEFYIHTFFLASADHKLTYWAAKITEYKHLSEQVGYAGHSCSQVDKQE